MLELSNLTEYLQTDWIEHQNQCVLDEDDKNNHKDHDKKSPVEETCALSNGCFFGGESEKYNENFLTEKDAPCPELEISKVSIANSENSSMPKAIWAVGIAFFLINIASCVVFGAIPIFMAALGLSKQETGRIEGTVEGIALLIRAFSGVMSDWFGRRKLFLLTGYGLCALSRFILAPSTTLWPVLLSRYMDKLGNGIQASPREAFIGDITPPHMLGRAFGLVRALGMGGSFLGSFGMLILALQFKGDAFPARALFWLASFCTLFSFLILFLFLKEDRAQSFPQAQRLSAQKQKISFNIGALSIKGLREFFQRGFQKILEALLELKQFSGTFWLTLIIVGIVKLGYFSGVFLIFQLEDSHATFLNHALHHQKGLASSVFLVIQNFACTLLSYPLGKLSDTLDRRWSIAIGLFFMISSLLLFSFLHHFPPNMIYIPIVFYGLQMGMQGALMALLSSTMPHHLHGTGFGLFFITSGLSVIFTNQVILGKMESSKAFLIIAGCSLVSLFTLFFLPKSKK